MKLKSLMLGGLVRWNLGADDPAVLPAIEEIGVLLLHPYAAPDSSKLMGFRLPVAKCT